MKVKIWTAAADDRFGTRATVHTNRRAAYAQWLEWQFPGEEEQEERAFASSFIDREDYDGLWEWKENFGIGEPLDTYAVEEHEIEIPELMTI